MTDVEEVQRKYNILMYGFERKGLPIPPEPIRTRNYSLSFEKYGSPCRFNEYDGVVLFQGLFESFQTKTTYMDSYLVHSCDTDELDKRKKEADLLLKQGGLICFLLTDEFIDHNKGKDFSATDLSKYHLNYTSLYRKSCHGRITDVNTRADEFRRFLDIYGAASSYFTNHNDSLDFRILAEVQSNPVGMLINSAEYFVPSLVPRPEAVEEYCHLLVDAITSVHNKLDQEIPSWTSGFSFVEEDGLQQELFALLDRVSAVKSRLEMLRRYKAALVHTGPLLVKDVSLILESTLNVKIDATDDFREDVKLLDKSGETIAVCEVKGVNRGIKREHINQTDSHRERSGFEGGFPAILIVNTNIKSARTIQEKEQEVAAEQVDHAARMKVLVMRTIDLLGLLRLVISGETSCEDARGLVMSHVGWLKIQNNEVHILP